MEEEIKQSKSKKDYRVFLAVFLTFVLTSLIVGGLAFYYGYKESIGLEKQVNILKEEIIKSEQEKINYKNDLQKIQNEFSDYKQAIALKSDNAEEIIMETNNIKEEANSKNDFNVLNEIANCTRDNPPRIEHVRYGKQLTLCGYRTGYDAYEFENENYILFIESIFDKEQEEHIKRLKTITTQEPYEIEDLTFIPTQSISFSNSPIVSNDLYFWGNFADGPGNLYDIFIYSPDSKKFLLFENKNWNNVTKITVLSSELNDPYFAQKNYRYSLYSEEELLKDEDIEIIINNEAYTKKEVDFFSDSTKIDLFECEPLIFSSKEYTHNIEREKGIVSKYINYFPNEFPCFQSQDGDLIEGYFKIENNKIEYIAEN